MTIAEDLWGAWTELTDYAVRKKDGALYDALIDVAGALEDLLEAMKCPKCGGEMEAVNDSTPDGKSIPTWQCPTHYWLVFPRGHEEKAAAHEEAERHD